MKKSLLWRATILVIFILLLTGGEVPAGGPWRIAHTGNPFRWDVSRPIVVNPDRGRLGRYGNADAVKRLLLPAMNRWISVPTARVRLTIGGALPMDVQNAEDFDRVWSSGYSPIVFDTDGRLLTQFGYSTRSTIAIASFADPFFETIVQGFAIINGCFVDGDPSNGEMSEAEMINSIAHELGHMLNLHHSQVNGHMFCGDTDDPSYRLFGPPPADSVELMYPLYMAGVGTRWLTRDDQAVLSYLYPADAATGYGSLSGTVLRADGYSRFQGANVVARNLDSPFYDAVAATSGQRYQSYNGGSVDFQLQGLYEITGLTPGARYAVELVNLLAVGSGYGSSIGPLYPQVRVPGLEEFYNGAAEGASRPPDDPLQYTEVRVEAGRTTGNIDLVCNRVMPTSAHIPVAYGVTNEGISTAGEVDVYSFQGRKYEYVRIAITAEQCCLEPALEVYDPDGRFLAAAYSSRLEVRLLLAAAGTYNVAVSDLEMKKQGRYKLTIEKLRDAPIPGAISFGETRTGTLDGDFQVDLYAFHGEAGDRIVASAGATGMGTNVEVELLDSRGVLLDQSSENDNKLVDTNLPATGEYMLAVRDPYGYSRGLYGVSVQRMKKPANAVAAEFGKTQSGNFAVAGEVITYTWSGSAGDPVVMRIGVTQDSQVSPRMYLYDPDGVPLHNPIGYNDWTSQIELVLPKSGEYSVCITNIFRYSLGSFGFSVQRLNAPGSATSIDFGTGRTVSLSKAAEIATYTWTAEAGDAVLLFLGNIADDDWDFRAQIYDPDGILVGSAPAYYRPVRLRADLEKSGRYTLLMYDWNTRAARYSLNIQRLNNPGNAVELAFGETRSAKLEGAAALATYTWTGSAGDSVAFRAVAPAAGALKLNIAVYDPDGLPVFDSLSTLSAVTNLILPKTGRYAALISDQTGTASGSYAIAAQRAPVPANAASLQFGSVLQESLTQPDLIRSYTYQGRVGDTVTIRVKPESTATSALRMDVFDPDGIVVHEGLAPSGNELVYWDPVAKSGRYLLLVSNTEGSGSGSYSLTASCDGCDSIGTASISELHFPLLNPAAAGYQGFAVCNLSTSPATLRFTAYDTSGAVLERKEKVLAAGTQVAFLPQELFGAAIAGKSGRVTVASDAPDQKGFYLLFDAASTFMDGSAGLSSGSYRWILTESVQANEGTSEISLHNLRNTWRIVTLDLMGSDGKTLESAKVQLLPLGSWTGRLDQLFTTGKPASDTFVCCSWCGGMDAFEMIRRPDSLAVHKAIHQDRVPRLLYAPQVAFGGGYSTQLSLTNSVNWESSVSVTLYDEEGKVYPEAAVNPLTLKVPAGGKAVADIAEAFGIPEDGQVRAGWLKISWEYGNLSGSVAIGDRACGSMTSLPLTGVGMREGVIPHVAQNAQYFTGIAMLNFTKRPADVTLRAYTKSGELSGESTLRLAPGERISRLLHELTPSVHEQTGGYIRIVSSQDLIIYSLFGTNSLSVLSAIPAMR